MSEVVILSDGAELRWSAEGGDAVVLDALALRNACRCAECRAAERRGDRQLASAAVIVACHEVGAYAVQLRFEDGHDRGIYPLSYLRELATGTPR